MGKLREKSYKNNNLDDGNKGKNETWHRHESLS